MCHCSINFILYVIFAEIVGDELVDGDSDDEAGSEIGHAPPATASRSATASTSSAADAGTSVGPRPKRSLKTVMPGMCS